MKLKQISPWISFKKMSILLVNENIKSWLIEKGPITKRIKSKESFKLNLIKDEICSVDDSEKNFLRRVLTKLR